MKTFVNAMAAFEATNTARREIWMQAKEYVSGEIDRAIKAGHFMVKIKQPSAGPYAGVWFDAKSMMEELKFMGYAVNTVCSERLGSQHDGLLVSWREPKL